MVVAEQILDQNQDFLGIRKNKYDVIDQKRTVEIALYGTIPKGNHPAVR